MTTAPVREGPRACRPDEVEAMIAMANAVMREGSSQSFLTDYPLVYAEENLPNVQIMKSGQTVVSVVPYLPKQIAHAGLRFRIGIISPTATHPEHRRQGYARRCLEACLAKMEADAIELAVLWTLPATFPFYEQAGFHAVPPQLDWVHGQAGDAALFQDHGHHIRRFDPRNSSSLRYLERLRDQDHCGVVRSERDSQILFSLPRMITYLASDNAGATQGYLVVCEGTHKPGILEAEGTPDAVESLLHHALKSSHAPELPIYLTKTSGVLPLLVRERLGSRLRPMESGPMMIRVNDPAKVLTAFQPWLEEQSLSLEANASRQELTNQIFGTFHDPSPARFSFPIPMLDHS